MKNNQKVLLIGGNGFLGSHLTQKLISEGFYVKVFDVISRNYTNPFFEEIIGDIKDVNVLIDSMKDVDTVYHLMSTTVPSTSNLDCIYDIESNLVNTIKILDAMKNSTCKKIVFISSGGTVYGEKGDVLINENESLNPISSYGIVKVAIENYIKLYSKLYGIQFNIFRVSNLYGLNQSKIGSNGIISTLIYNIVNDVPLKIWGDGEQAKDYIYVSDLVDLLVLSVDDFKNDIFNVGSGQVFKVNDIIEILKTQFIKIPQIEYTEIKDFDVRRVQLDIEKVKTHFKWRPKIQLNEGVQLILSNGRFK